MTPRKTSDGRDVPRLLGARERTMSLIAAVLEDEARREAPARSRQRSQARGRAGFLVAAGLGCVLAALAGGALARTLDTPELDRLEAALATGELQAIEAALPAVEDDSDRARSARALARTHQAAWGSVPLAVADGALRQAPEDAAASSLMRAMRGEAVGDQPWSMGLAAGRTLDRGEIDAAIEALRAMPARPLGATRTLAALQFVRGDVSAAHATLHAAGVEADVAFFEAWRKPAASLPQIDVPGRLALLQAQRGVAAGELRSARALLEQAREEMLPWDPVGIVGGLRVGLLLGDADGLRAWAEDPRFSASVRTLAGAYASAADGDWGRARADLADHEPDAPWVAYLLGYAAAEQRRFSGALHLAATARRGMPGCPELDVLSAWISAHLLDADGAHRRLRDLAAQAPWAPRVWTALAEAAELAGVPNARVTALYERALEREHRPAAAAVALAARSGDEEAVHLWTMANELEPGVARHRVGLGRAQLRVGRLREAWFNLESLPDGDGQAWLVLAELALARAEAGHDLDPRIQLWLERAGQGGAEPERIDRMGLRAALAGGHDVASRALAVAKAAPRDPEAVALAVRALAAGDRLAEARRLGASARRRIPWGTRAPVTLALAAALHEHGETREAAQLAYKGWSGLPAEHSAVRTLGAARGAIAIWLDLGNTSGARAIARDLTERLPLSPDAWQLRAEVQVAAGALDYACRSLGRARTLDPNVSLTGTRCEHDPS